MMRVLATAAFILSVLGSLSVPASGEPASADVSPFAGARFDETKRLVRFWTIVPVDWEKVARRNFHRFDIDKPSSNDVNYLRENIWEISGEAQIKVRAPLEPVLTRGSYSLISASGILPLKLAALEATIDFGFDQAKPPNLASRKFYGEVISRRIPHGGGGIVYWSPSRERPVRIASARAEIRQTGKRFEISYVDGQSRSSADLPRPWHSKFLAAYGLRIEGQRYLFVAWPPDTEGFEIFCAHDISLYAVRETLEQVASSTYDCDV